MVIGAGLVWRAVFIVTVWRVQPELGVVVQWDLTQGAELWRVGWPKNFQGPVWYVEGPGVLHVALPGGRKETTDFNRIQLPRKQNELDGIRVFLWPGTADDVYARAKNLAEVHHLDNEENLAELDGWYKVATAPVDMGGRSYAVLFDRKRPPQRSIEVRRNFFQPEMPWYIVLGIGVQPVNVKTPLQQDLDDIREIEENSRRD